MATFDTPAIEGTRGVLVNMGLGTPLSRAFVAGSVIGIAAYVLKLPRTCFDEDGEMRPFAVVSKAPTATNAHFLAVPVAAAALAYVFT